MVLILSPAEVAFNRAKATITSKLDQEWWSIECQCVNDRIADVQIEQPGRYDVWLSEMDIRICSTDALLRENAVLVPFELEVLQEDLDGGEKTVIVPDGVFRITVLNGKRQPVPHSSLQAWREHRTTGVESTILIQTDENGACLLYSNPTQCVLFIDPGFGIIIEHLP